MTWVMGNTWHSWKIWYLKCFLMLFTLTRWTHLGVCWKGVPNVAGECLVVGSVGLWAKHGYGCRTALSVDILDSRWDLQIKQKSLAFLNFLFYGKWNQVNLSIIEMPMSVPVRIDVRWRPPHPRCQLWQWFPSCLRLQHCKDNRYTLNKQIFVEWFL